MKSRPVIETNQLEEQKRARKEREKETENNVKEATKAAKNLGGLSEFQFSNEDLENLEEFTLPRDAVGMGSCVQVFVHNFGLVSSFIKSSA